jgi:hypothetical protein
MKKILKDRYIWGIVALFLTFIIYTYFQDSGKVGWLPSDATTPLTDTVIDVFLFCGIITLSAFRFQTRGGIIAAVAAFPILAWCHKNGLAEVDTWVYLLFGGVSGVVVAIIIGSYVATRNQLQKANVKL